MFDEYFNNIRKVHDAGCSFTCEMTPTDDLEPYIEDIKELCMKNIGSYPHLTIARNDTLPNTPVLSQHSLDEYIKVWSSFNSGMLNYKKEIFMKKRNEFCYAGAWSAYINVATGDMRRCYGDKVITNIYDDLSKPISFRAIGNCKQDHCYNGHALLTFGVIPSARTCSYEKIRQHKYIDGSNWVNDKMCAFMNTKLEDSNEKYSKVEQMKIKSRPLRNKVRKLFTK